MRLFDSVLLFMVVRPLERLADRLATIADDQRGR